MLRLRPYKASDADIIVTWLKDELTFRNWAADRYKKYPIQAGDINAYYDAMDANRFFPMTAFDESGVVGHFILRFTDEARIILRLGFVIIDDTKRGNCYGREMIELAVKFGFDNLMAEMITLGVFENNESARRCYRAAGFRNAGSAPAETFLIMGKEWNCFEMEMDRYSGIMPVVGIHENGSVIDGINIQPPYYHLYDLLVYYKEKRGYEYSLETVYLNNTEENRAYIQTLLTKLTVWMLSKGYSIDKRAGISLINPWLPVNTIEDVYCKIRLQFEGYLRHL